MQYARFDDMAWPLDTDHSLVWELRNGSPTREQILSAASILSAYDALIRKTVRQRDYIVRNIKQQFPEMKS